MVTFGRHGTRTAPWASSAASEPFETCHGPRNRQITLATDSGGAGLTAHQLKGRYGVEIPGQKRKER